MKKSVCVIYKCLSCIYLHRKLILSTCLKVRGVIAALSKRVAWNNFLLQSQKSLTFDKNMFD